MWAGLPLVSMPGEQMRSRAGATMSYALGIVTWLVRNLEDYEEVAVRLAKDSNALRRARLEMERAVEESPFFDTRLWAKGFERAWSLMWDTFQATGEPGKLHIRAVPDRLEEEGQDWEPQGIMIGTTRNVKAAGGGGGGGATHNPLKVG
jgi:hypothetical protein